MRLLSAICLTVLMAWNLPQADGSCFRTQARAPARVVTVSYAAQAGNSYAGAYIPAQYASNAAYVAPVNYNIAYNPDYFFSTASVTQASLIADAVIGRLVLLRVNLGGNQQPQQVAAPTPRLNVPAQPKLPVQPMPAADYVKPAQVSGRSAPTPVTAAFAKEVAANCLECHGGVAARGKGFSLDDLATVPADKRDKAFRYVSAGMMPPKTAGGPRPQEALELYFDWADAPSVAAR